MQIIKLAQSITLLFGLCSAPVLMAQDGLLEPMGGVGGAQRQIENKVIAPNIPKPSSDKPSVSVVPASQIPVENAAGSASSETPWEIQAIALKGDLAFAENIGVKAILQSELVGGQPKKRQEVQEALRKIFRKFIDEKYYLARVTLPRNPYDEQTKTLTVLVEAGLFGDVKIKFASDREDGRWFSRAQIAKRLKEISKGETFNYQKLYNALAEINAHPDLTLDTKITVRKPIEGTNEMRRVVRYADLDFVVKESIPLHAVLDVNNYGTKAVDEWQAGLTLQYLNLTKADDVLTLNPSMSLDSSLMSLAGSYVRPHDIWKGGATTLYGGWSDLNADNIVPNIDLVGQGWFMGVVHSYKLVDDEDRLISLSAGLVYRYIEDQFSAFKTTLQQRDITVLPLSIALSYSARKPDFLRGRNFATIQAIYNLQAGGGNTLDEMRVNADDNYSIARLQLARLQPIFGTADISDAKKQLHQWILFMKAEGQYSSCPLIPAEELALGGQNTVRGYTTKGYMGDDGVYGTLEVRTPILLDMFSHMVGHKTARNPLDRIQFVAFTDAGYLQTTDPLPGAEDSETLLSIGAGVRLAVTQYSQLRLDVGVPVADASGNDDSSEYYLDWQVQF